LRSNFVLPDILRGSIRELRDPDARGDAGFGD
jgi:hypothetical protein